MPHFCQGSAGGAQWKAGHIRLPGSSGPPQQEDDLLGKFKYDPEPHYIKSKCPAYHLSYEQLGKSQHEWKRSTNVNTKMNKLLE